jgi:hypothetical protein
MPRYDDEDDFDDRPRRRRHEDDDDYDDEPRPRRRKAKKPSGPPVGLIVGVVAGLGVFALLLLAVGAYLLLGRSTPRPPTIPPPTVAAPLPSAAPSPSAAKPAANPSVTITAVRRATGFAGKPTLEIDYRLAGGAMIPGMTTVVIKKANGPQTEATIHGMMGMRPGATTGTWTIEQFGFMGGGFAGKMDVWVERRMGLSGEVISNVFTLE